MAAPQFRVRFVTDDDASFEECNGEPRPLTEEEYQENHYLEKGKPVPYERYLEYHGNPDRHVYLSCEVQKQCPCCQSWDSWTAGLHGIDFMDDNLELKHAGDYWMQEKNTDWFTPDHALELPGYLRDVALDTLIEAGWEAPRHVYCQYRRCRYHHQVKDPRYTPNVDERYCAGHQTPESRTGRKARK